MDVVEQVVEASWLCEPDAFARPARGRDRFTIRDGRIARLETELLELPGAGLMAKHATIEPI